MNKMMNWKRVILFVVLNLFLLSACAAQGGEVKSLRIAVLPVLDTLPLYVAQQEGFFEEAGIQVELVPVNSAPERDQLMQAGQIDGMLNELVSTILYNQDETRVQVVRFARTATSEYPLFRILASPGSGIQQPADLRNVPVAVSDGTIIEYTTERLLQDAGLGNDEIEKVSIPKIPDRMALLISGEIAAANLPDPVASLALLNGCTLVVDDTVFPEISFSVYSFSLESLQQKPEAVQSFLQAIEKAVVAINTDKTRWNDLLQAQNLVPAPVLPTYVLPDYPAAGVPSPIQFADALSWLVGKGLAEGGEYTDSINPSFLP